MKQQNCGVMTMLWYLVSFMPCCTLFFTLSQDCRLAKIWLSIAWTHNSLSSYVDASKFHVWPVKDTMMNSKESSCSVKHKWQQNENFNITHVRHESSVKGLKPIHRQLHSHEGFCWIQQHSNVGWSCIGKHERMEANLKVLRRSLNSFSYLFCSLASTDCWQQDAFCWASVILLLFQLWSQKLRLFHQKFILQWLFNVNS